MKKIINDGKIMQIITASTSILTILLLVFSLIFRAGGEQKQNEIQQKDIDKLKEVVKDMSDAIINQAQINTNQQKFNEEIKKKLEVMQPTQYIYKNDKGEYQIISLNVRGETGYSYKDILKAFVN